jgi:hypothetical protein
MHYNPAMVNDEYIAKITERISGADSRRQLEMKESLRKAELLKHAGPNFWRDLENSLLNAVERIRQISPSLKVYPGRRYGELTLSLAVGSNPHFRDLGISLDSSSYQINYFIKDQKGTFLPDIVGEELRYIDITIDWDKAFTQNSSPRLPMSVDDLVRRLIDIVSET